MVNFFVNIVYWANNSGRGAKIEADNKQSFIIDFMKTNTKNFEKLVQTFSINIHFYHCFFLHLRLCTDSSPVVFS